MKNLRRYIKHWRSLLIIVFFSTVAIVFFNIMWGDPNLATAMVAFGTLILALVTALHILNSGEQEKQRRREARINEIVEWASVGQRLLSGYLPTMSGGDRRDTIKQLAELTARKTGMLTGAKVFGDSFFAEFHEAADSLDLFNDWLKEPFDKRINNQLKALGISDVQEHCEKCFSKLLESAVNLRSELNL